MVKKLVSKDDYTRSIIEMLSVEPTHDGLNLFEEIHRMNLKSLKKVHKALVMLTTPSEVKVDDFGVKAPLELMPTDMAMPKDIAEMNEQLDILADVGAKIKMGWKFSDIPAAKRFIGINERIIHNCKRMISNQLYENISIHETHL